MELWSNAAREEASKGGAMKKGSEKMILEGREGWTEERREGGSRGGRAGRGRG